MHSYSLATLALGALMAAAPVLAGDWWVIGYTSSFCTVNDDTNDWNWKGSDGDCHSFSNPSGGSCVYESYSGSVGSGTECVERDNAYITSMSYLFGTGNGGVGCIFWSNPDCTGAIEPVNQLDEIEDCYQFTSISPRSFSCS